MSPNYKTTKIQQLNAVTLILLVIASSCASQSKSKKLAHTKANQTKIIEAKLGKNTSSEINKSNTFILFQQKPEGDQVAKQYKYVVIRKSDNQISLEGVYKLGYVKWVSDTEIEVLSLPSVVEQDESKFKKIYTIALPTNIQ